MSYAQTEEYYVWVYVEGGVNLTDEQEDQIIEELEDYDVEFNRCWKDEEEKEFKSIEINIDNIEDETEAQVADQNIQDLLDVFGVPYES